MSKDRARRREAREAIGARPGARTSARPSGRTDRRRATAALARPAARRRRRLPRFGSGRYSRRTRTQRATIVLVLLVVLGMVWFVAEDWGVRVGLTLAALIATPALVTLALGRSNR